MTSPISSYSPSDGLTDPIGSEKAAPVATPPGASSATPSATGEAVTLTPDAQTSTELLEAARAAVGVDDQAVLSLKAAISSGTYQVPPENLAASIVAALAETRS